MLPPQRHRRDGLTGCRLLLLPPPSGLFPAYFPSQGARTPPLVAAIELSKLGLKTPPRREERGIGGGGSRKRFRTKFTAEQKEKMQAFAEKLGWRIQKNDDVALEEFCVEVGSEARAQNVDAQQQEPPLLVVGGGGEQEPSPLVSVVAISC